MIRTLILSVVIFSSLFQTASGQLGVTYDLKKPAKYENRFLASETSPDKKFTRKRHFIQNTITHYNYFFNANVKLNEILARAKAQHRDDYTKLLSFYNYSLDATASQKKELDSVVSKCTAGILIHDTRNDWIDNLYMLIGRTFFLRKNYDSAYVTFQWVNYAFSPKEKDGYDKPIGSNYNHEEGGSAFVVSTKEHLNIAQKMFSMPPSRNESLIWLVRTYLARNQYTQAAGLIQILLMDPYFPKRLYPYLEEMQALWFYDQSLWDSSAVHLEKALDNAADGEERARWEYLAGQMYERAHDPYHAHLLYERTVSHTLNPVLEVYARLNSIRQNETNDPNFIQKNIDALVKMARKDRYEPYRDIIYYTAAQIELERHNRPGAEGFLQKAIRAAAPNSPEKNKAFLQLGNMSFEDKNYRAAKNDYDSVKTGDPALGDIGWLPERKAFLDKIVAQMAIIDRQDSLQKIAALPLAERDAYLKKLLRLLRKQQGLQEDDQTGSGSVNPNAKTAPDLFNTGSVSAEWYFNNNSLKGKGFNDFKTRWGNRANVDNWRLSSLASQQRNNNGRNANGANPDQDGKQIAAPTLSYKSLLDNLPLTPAKLKSSNDSIEKAIFTIGKSCQDGPPDYETAIKYYNQLLERFPETGKREETLFNLYYCYKKLGDEDNARRILQLMQQKYPTGSFTARAMNPGAAEETMATIRANATHKYESIYNSFIEGNFDEALAGKKQADSLYGDKYWTPQLLYIESVYFIHQRQDDQAKQVLRSIIVKYPGTPMAAKAERILDVLGRRKQIEDYLTKLQIQRAKDDTLSSIDSAGAKTAVKKTAPKTDSVQNVKEDTTQYARAKIRLHAAGMPALQHKPGTPADSLNKLKIDAAGLNKIQMDSGQLAGLRRKADSLDAAMLKARNDADKRARIQHQADSIKTAMARLRNDSLQLIARIQSLHSAFSFRPDQAHEVVILMTKVDPVYVTEGKNAFDRYNRETFYNQTFHIESLALTDTSQMVLISRFENAAAALDYLEKAKKIAASEIIPWLPAAKYSFLIISEGNLETLKGNKDVYGYRKFLETSFPGKF
ncbi:MAG: hypothetical protein P4L51_04895 [Puia sp.]|nr:hypothetical protein [Puia sp.]